MADFTKAELSHSIVGDQVKFIIDGKVRFSDRELNWNWDVLARFFEHDLVFDDKLGDKLIRITADGPLVEFEIVHWLPKDVVDTEPLNEEVFATLDIAPVVVSPGGHSSTKTNRVDVAV